MVLAPIFEADLQPEQYAYREGCSAQDAVKRVHWLLNTVVSVCRRISELTHRRYGLLDQRTVVRRLNRVMTGWANYFQLGQVSPAYKAVDAHAIRRLRQWLCRKHKVRAGKYVRFPDKRLWDDLGLTRFVSRTARFPWANA